MLELRACARALGMGLDVEAPDFSGAMPLLGLGVFPVVFWFLLRVDSC